eukprot:12345163-Alexandrium_andersonii.AAC.1
MMLASTQLKGFWLAMMICWNAEFGPDKEHGRKHQLSEAMQACFATATPESTPLFLAHSSDLVASLQALGVTFEGDELHQAWAYMKDNTWTTAGFTRCNLNRFMGSLHTASKRLPRWAVDRFQRTWLALELDLLGAKKVTDKVCVKMGAAETMSEAGGSTSAARITFEDRNSLAFAKNALVASVVLLDNQDHRKVVQLVCACAKPVLAWHTEQSRSLRSAVATSEWLVEQVVGGLMQHIEAIILTPGNTESLAEC